jgi:hypothetical protein
MIDLNISIHPQKEKLGSKILERLTLLLLALTFPLLPAIQVCNALAALLQASFARISPVVAKHAKREDKRGRHGGGTVSNYQFSVFVSLFSPFPSLHFLDPLLSSLCGVVNELCTYLSWA